MKTAGNLNLEPVVVSTKLAFETPLHIGQGSSNYYVSLNWSAPLK